MVVRVGLVRAALQLLNVGRGAANDSLDDAVKPSPDPAASVGPIYRKCGGPMRAIEVVSDPDDIARVLGRSYVRPSFARASRIRIRRSMESGAGMPAT